MTEASAARGRSVCVFCGSASGSRPLYAAAAQRLGAALAARDLTLVYGAGDIGLMGIVANAALAAGGKVVGVIPQALVERELGHKSLTELHVVETMHQRKALMADRSDAFLALPGGFGTADELFEILTWAQLGIHTRPVGLINVAGYFDPLLRWLDHCVAEGFVRARHRELLLIDADPVAALERVLARPPIPPTDKWITDADR